MGVIANQCRNTGVAIPQKFPRTNRKLARAAIGRPLFYAFFGERNRLQLSIEASSNACHCEPARRLVWQSVPQSLPCGVVLRAANLK